MINHKHSNPYNYKLRASNVKYIINAGPYKTTHAVKVPFSMIELYIRNIITHSFHVDNARGDDGIIYGMIIGYLLMVKLGLKADSGLKIV